MLNIALLPLHFFKWAFLASNLTFRNESFSTKVFSTAQKLGANAFLPLAVLPRGHNTAVRTSSVARN